jgi:capsular exopolysaccharide synthesis family protein
MKTNNSSQIEKFSQTHRFSEVEEGGLNLVEIRETIFRQFHVIVAITVITTSLALFKALNRDPIYQGSFEILSEPVTIETKVTSSGSQSRETTEAITAVRLNEVQLKTLKSPNIIGSVVQKLKQNYPEINYDSIVSQLSLTTDKEETVLEVSYEDTDREQVKDVLQALKTAYLNYSLERRQFGVNRGLEFLNQQIPKIQAKVDELNQELQKLRTKHHFIDPKIQGTQISERIDNLIAQQIERKSELEKTQKLANLAKKELNQQSNTSTTAMEVGTSRYNALLEDLKEIDHQIAQQSAIFSDKSLEIQTLKEQRQQIISLIDREIATIQQKIDNQVNLQQEQEQALNNEITSMQQSLQEWSGVTREYENIERQMTITVEQLNELLIQREALRLEASQKEPPWRLLTPVGDPQTDATSTANYVVLGTLLGLLVGVGAALILDKHQNIVYGSNQVEAITNQPILGIIPYDRSNKKLSFTEIINLIQSSESPDEESSIQIYNRNSNSNNLLSPSVEAFRFFAANLGLFEANNHLNSLIVTSSVSGEGKSTIVVNLAKAVAAIGHKVLVVDADLRSSTRLTSTMSLTSHQGLSELLLFNDLSLDGVVQKSFLEENLFILSSGNTDIHVDISKLLASTKMRNLMEELKQNFDLVIYDVPAIVDYADVSLLANKTDGVVLVTGLGKLNASKLKEAMNQLNISKTPVLGVVINKITAQV